MPRVKAPKAKLWKAIREKCINCSGGSHKEVELCPIEDCSLYQYRFGRASQNATE